MTEEEFKSRYRDQILPHNRNPFHFEEQTGPFVDAYNPLCGDHYKLFITDHDSQIKDVHFHGFGCAVSKASTSILLKSIHGKSINETIVIIQNFLSVLEGKVNLTLDSEELNSLAELRNFNGRMDCVRLSWEALLKELDGKK